MNEFRGRISDWWDGAQPVAMFIMRLMLILAIIALPCIIGIRTIYYNFVVFDESPLSVEIANEMTAVSWLVAPLFSVLGKYMVAGLRRAYSEGKVYCASCSIVEWLLNVELIVAGGRIALVLIVGIVTFIAS